MNPYLEQTSCWEMLHHQLCGQATRELVAQLRPRYLVKLEHRLYIHERSAAERRFFGTSDVGVARSVSPSPETATMAVHVQAPAYGLIPQAVEIEKQAYIEIVDRERAAVITAIEILSPTNKYAGEDREQYLAKRRAVLHSRVHLVEVDLLRGGPRMPIEELSECDYDYCAIVSRSYERPKVGVWPWRLRDPIPPIPIPVNEGDDDAQLDLKPLIDRVHDEFGFADYIYEGTPEPRLATDDLNWAMDCLKNL